MKLSLLEQETILLYNQAEQTADIYTHDPKLMKKLSALSKEYPKQVIKKDAHNFVVPKNCVSVRKPCCDEHRKAARERAKTNGYLPPLRSRTGNIAPTNKVSP